MSPDFNCHDSPVYTQKHKRSNTYTDIHTRSHKREDQRVARDSVREMKSSCQEAKIISSVVES